MSASCSSVGMGPQATMRRNALRLATFCARAKSSDGAFHRCGLLAEAGEVSERRSKLPSSPAATFR